MASPPEEDSRPPFFESNSPFRKAVRYRRARLFATLNPRERFGDLLNALEGSRTLRLRLYAVLAAGAVLGIAGAWLYPDWSEDNAIHMARQWLAAGKLDRAAEAVQAALSAAPQRVEAWQMAADYARRAGLKRNAATYAHHAAILDPANPALALDWAALALAADLTEDAEAALAQLSVSVRDGSAQAQRLAGELARRHGDLAAARLHFETALRLEGPLPINEVPLGVVLADAPPGPDRRHGQALLSKWTNDPAWGAEALRALLTHALADDDRPAMLRWAAALRAHPAREPSDGLNSLLALAKADEGRFGAELEVEEKNSAANPADAAVLIGWLSGMGRGAEALRWARTLPGELTGRPPVIVAVADALRVAGDWPGLQAWIQSGEWEKLDLVRQAYAALASRQLGNGARADELWRGLRDTSRVNGGEALFLAGMFYSWGWRDEAVELWWLAADQPPLALSALGPLARHYQLQRDAEGQFRAFRQLHTLRTQDAAIANNFAYLAALTDTSEALALEAARANHTRFPDRLEFRSTYAFVLLRQNHAEEALALLEPFGAELARLPELAFTYGLVLAAAGRTAEAGTVLANVDPERLTTRETALLNAVRPRP